jgi:hypothetical protein
MTLIGFVGSTSSQQGYPETFGLIYDSPEESLRHSGDLDFFTVLGVPHYRSTVFTGFSRNETIAIPFVGHWLVRPVPLPSNFILIASGLALLGGVIRRKKSARH